ncbi:FAD-dependent oxidoreductase [Catenulispora yoronensis]|uniref:FAD-dependent oxidoreductase n=1 Tax=Catenulispora yoronensis TaxID=450799 RepID=UPI0031D13309
MIVVGAGVAGLACAADLVAAGLRVTVLEASDAPGGRMRSDHRDGFVLDRGFQVFNPYYPQVRKRIRAEGLDLHDFAPGFLLHGPKHRTRIANPLADRQMLKELRNGLPGSLRDLAALSALSARDVCLPTRRLKDAPDESAYTSLRAAGLSAGFIDRALRPFFAGVFLEPDLTTSSRMLHLVWRSMLRGRATLPAQGIGAVPEQLARRLPPGTLRLETPVAAVTDEGVVLVGGEAIAAGAVVVATGPGAATALIGPALAAPEFNQPDSDAPHSNSPTSNHPTLTPPTATPPGTDQATLAAQLDDEQSPPAPPSATSLSTDQATLASPNASPLGNEQSPLAPPSAASLSTGQPGYAPPSASRPALVSPIAASPSTDLPGIAPASAGSASSSQHGSAVPMRSVTTYYHAAPHSPLREPIIIVDQAMRILNTAVLTDVCPAYSADGRALISTSVLGSSGDHAGLSLVEVLGEVYGVAAEGWEFLGSYDIGEALPVMVPPWPLSRSARVGVGRYVCGDYRATGSVQGAMASGARAAREVVADLGS